MPDVSNRGFQARIPGAVAFGTPELWGGAPNIAAPGGGSVPEPEVPGITHRRRFTADYKGGIVEEADACREEGAIGALLRGHHSGR